MATLSIYLPPFSPDYSGVSSVLFDLHTVTAMHDASGCTGNYTGYDESRWYGSESPIYCSGLREIDAVLGNDEKLIQKMISAAEDIQPDLMALVGSPVPMVIGSDMPGIAMELEQRTGIPTLGFDTTGTAYYDVGVVMATTALLQRFTPKQEPIAGTVNLLGACPMDFGAGENLQDLQSLLESAGYSVTCCLSMGYTLEGLKRAGSAQVNLAISKAGFRIAQYMEKHYGIPYLCGLPVGEMGQTTYLNQLAQVCAQNHSCVLQGASCHQPASILILGEQVQANAIRLALENEYGVSGIQVGTLFGLEPQLARPEDVNLPSERSVKEQLTKGYATIIADPLLEALLPQDHTPQFIPNPHFAVSSKLEVGRTQRILGAHFHHWMSGKKDFK